LKKSTWCERERGGEGERDREGGREGETGREGGREGVRPTETYHPDVDTDTHGEVRVSLECALSVP
jgi:hypothetical protein